MQLLDDLRGEHVLIERLAGSLRTFAAGLVRGPEESAAYLRFFRLYAGRYHHAREEEVLFPALIATEVPGDKGPLKILLDAHQAMGRMLDAMESSGITLPLAERYGRALLHHIDAENSVLFPESEIRLRAKGGAQLPTRPPDAEELAARADGERMAEKYPPTEFAGIFRGEGCAACHAYGEGCDGIEREWWSELEWEDALDRMGNG
jgi:hemerythrin-like domain-containing protein